MEMGGGIEVLLLLGDIMETHTDAIVNPCNERLRHSNGLGALISLKGGE